MSSNIHTLSSALILAGGNSSRFGTDKAFVPFNNTTLIEHIIEQLNTIFTEVIISAQDPLKYDHLHLTVCQDLLQKTGPLGGIHAGLKTANSDYLFVTACDMPFISKTVI
jgi:molybdopterin-guanine dinucleotide biosynthesis protein A